jgi:hypothetical protein
MEKRNKQIIDKKNRKKEYIIVKKHKTVKVTELHKKNTEQEEKKEAEKK